MNLDHLTLAIRPRHAWEAVDLGTLIARHWWWPMVKVWCLLTLPLLLLALVLPLNWVLWLPFLLWWLKPLVERPLLLIISQGIFAQQLTTRQVLRACPRLCRAQLLPSLLWRRLSLSRSMDLPVAQLEGLTGPVRNQRLSILHRHDDGPAKWLTLMGVHVESLLLIGLGVLLASLLPAELHIDLLAWDFWLNSRTGVVLQCVFYYLAIAAVAPFYVACGFSLYLNRRIKLEGWDLEIAFKRMLLKRGLALSSLVAVCTGLLVLSPWLSQPVSANAGAPQVTAADERAQLRNQIDTILNGADFHQKSTVKTLRLKPRAQAAPEIPWPPLLQKVGQALNTLFSGFASVAEILLWALVLGASLFFAVKYRALIIGLSRWRPAPKPPRFVPHVLFGMDVREVSLPADISASAEQLWQEQQYRAALALLYRASLARLLGYGLSLHTGDTELECLQLAHRQAQTLGLTAATLGYFEQLTEAWRALAYGHVSPAPAVGQHLCAQWNQHWSAAELTSDVPR